MKSLRECEKTPSKLKSHGLDLVFLSAQIIQDWFKIEIIRMFKCKCIEM